MIRWTYAGVRPLYDDGASKAQEATRDYVLKLDAPAGAGAAPLGLRRQDHHLSQPRRAGAGAARAASSRHARRPGRRRRRCPAAISRMTSVDGADRARSPSDYPFLAAAHGAPAVPRLWHARRLTSSAARRPRGSRPAISAPASRAARGQLPGRRRNGRETADDILWRRSKLGLHLPRGAAALEAYLAGRDEPRRDASRCNGLRRMTVPADDIGFLRGGSEHSPRTE